MSVSFYPAKMAEDGSVCLLNRCDCDERYNDAFVKAESEGGPLPDFRGCEICDAEMNLSNQNALDLLEWVGLEPIGYGHIKARELAARCRRRLWDEPRNYDVAVEGYTTGGDGTARVIYSGREDGYLRHKTEVLLKICEVAGDHIVAWS